MTVPAVPTVPTAPAEAAALPEPAESPDLVSGRRFALTHPASLLIAALIGGGLAYCFDTSSRLAVTSVAVVQGLLIVAWVFGTPVVGRIGAIVIGAGTAAGSDVAVTHRQGQLGSLVAVVGLALIAMFGHQLLRGRRRVNVVESLAGIALLVVAVAALSTIVELRYQVDGPVLAVAVVLCVSAAVVVGHLIDWIWVPLRFDPAVNRGLLAVAGSVIAGAAVTLVRLRHSVEFTGQRAVLLGATLALVTALFGVAAAYVGATDPVAGGRVARIARPLATTLFTFALAAPFAYLLCLALRG